MGASVIIKKVNTTSYYRCKTMRKAYILLRFANVNNCALTMQMQYSIKKN